MGGRGMGMTGFLRRNWFWLLGTLVLAALAANVWIHDGGYVLVVIGAATIGVAGVIFGAAYGSGASVVRHADVYERQLPAVEAQQRLLETTIRRKELRK
jgi:hypothetical protein